MQKPCELVPRRMIVTVVGQKMDNASDCRLLGELVYRSRPDFKPLDRFKVTYESRNLSMLVSICDRYYALEVSRTSVALNQAGWPDSKPGQPMVRMRT